MEDRIPSLRFEERYIAVQKKNDHFKEHRFDYGSWWRTR